MALAACAGLLHCWPVLAQTEAGGVTKPMRVPDSIAERVRACTACHGKEGRATNQGYFPRIAGKPAGYLYNQLVNFREGRRTNAAMTYLVDQLSNEYLMETAQYFGSLDLPYPPPQTTGAPAAVMQLGETLATKGDPGRNIPACMACHGRKLTGVAPAFPGLVGLPRDYLTAQFGSWKTGKRKAASPDCMAQIGAQMTSEDISSVATWLSAQPVPADSRPAPALEGALPIPCGSGAQQPQP